MSRILAILAVFGLLFTSACALMRNASMTVTQQGKDIDFHLRTRGFHGLSSFRICRTDTEEELWCVNLNYFRGEHLTYGEVPENFRTFNGGLNNARQEYPSAARKPAPLPPSAMFLVELHCSYDAMFGPSFQSYTFLFATDATGGVSRVTRPERVTADDLPKTR
jgi:hypothetical protein